MRKEGHGKRLKNENFGQVKALAEIYTMHSFAPFGIESQKPKRIVGRKEPGPYNPGRDTIWLKTFDVKKKSFWKIDTKTDPLISPARADRAASQ